MTNQPPSIGRIVHFVLASGQHRAAIVVNAWDTLGDQGRANLTVHLDAANDLSYPDDQNPESGSKPILREHVCGDLIGGIYLGDAALHLSSIGQDEDTKAPGTWHWPERE